MGAALNKLLGHVEQALGARHESESQVRQFVADASHELRTPLASIRGYAELVRRSPDDVPVSALQAMSRVESESERMTALLEDMLLLARLDAGRPLATEPVDLTVLASTPSPTRTPPAPTTTGASTFRRRTTRSRTPSWSATTTGSARCWPTSC